MPGGRGGRGDDDVHRHPRLHQLTRSASSLPRSVHAQPLSFERIVPVIHAHGGHVDKYVGDGLLAVSALPDGTGNNRRRARGAALESRRRRGRGVRGQDLVAIGIGLELRARRRRQHRRRRTTEPVQPATRHTPGEAATGRPGDTVRLGGPPGGAPVRCFRGEHVLEERPAVPLEGQGQNRSRCSRPRPPRERCQFLHLPKRAFRFRLSASRPTSRADPPRLRADPRRDWARRRRGSRGPPARPRSLATYRAGRAPRPTP